MRNKLFDCIHMEHYQRIPCVCWLNPQWQSYCLRSIQLDWTDRCSVAEYIYRKLNVHGSKTTPRFLPSKYSLVVVVVVAPSRFHNIKEEESPFSALKTNRRPLYIHNSHQPLYIPLFVDDNFSESNCTVKNYQHFNCKSFQFPVLRIQF